MFIFFVLFFVRCLLLIVMLFTYSAIHTTYIYVMKEEIVIKKMKKNRRKVRKNEIVFKTIENQYIYIAKLCCEPAKLTL